MALDINLDERLRFAYDYSALTRIAQGGLEPPADNYGGLHETGKF